jgi:hypothetical protein
MIINNHYNDYEKLLIRFQMYLKQALMAMEANSDLRASDDSVNKPSRCLTSLEWEALEQLWLLLNLLRLHSRLSRLISM